MKTVKYYKFECDDKNRPQEVKTDEFFELIEVSRLLKRVSMCENLQLEFKIYFEEFDIETDEIVQQICITKEFKYKKCDRCSWDIEDDEGDIIEHFCIDDELYLPPTTKNKIMEITLENINSLDGSEISAYYDANRLSIPTIISKLTTLSDRYSEACEGLIFDTLLCEINLRIQKLQELPNCVKINGKVYLVGETTKDEDNDFVTLTELFDVTTEMATEGKDCMSVYVSSIEIFEQATNVEKLEVRDYFNL